MKGWLKGEVRMGLAIGFLGLISGARLAVATPGPGAIAGFNRYVARVEARLAAEHQAGSTFVVPIDFARLRRGEPVIERITASDGADLPGAMLHDWRGTAFVPNARAADFERLLRDFNAYPRYFSPQVLEAKVLAHEGGRYQMRMRVRQKHVITVVLDTSYDVTFGRLDAQHGYSISRSTRVSEIESQGTAHERALTSSQEHGFLWRLNTYWTWEERDGGLVIQIESVSLTRSIPTGLGWAVRPFVESVPRESLEFTLRSACKALEK